MKDTYIHVHLLKSDNSCLDLELIHFDGYVIRVVNFIHS